MSGVAEAVAVGLALEIALACAFGSVVCSVDGFVDEEKVGNAVTGRDERDERDVVGR